MLARTCLHLKFNYFLIAVLIVRVYVFWILLMHKIKKYFCFDVWALDKPIGSREKANDFIDNNTEVS